MATRLQNGQRVRLITVRRLLELFDAERRGIQKVQEIRNVLNGLNLVTDPDFEHAYIDSVIKLRLKEPHLSEDEPSLDDGSDLDNTEVQSGANGSRNGVGALAGSQSDNNNDAYQLNENTEPDEDDEEEQDGPTITEPFNPNQIRI